MIAHRNPYTRRLVAPVAAFIVAAAALLPATAVHAQAPEVSFVNAGRDVVERREEGGFVARPVFDRPIAVLFYGLRDADSGDWLTGIYRVLGGEQHLAHGWEYTFEYPDLPEHPDLDPGDASLLVMQGAEAVGDPYQTFHAVVPVYQPDNIWDRMLAALDPERWARAVAAWAIQGVHGTLCGVLERAVGADAENCRGS